MAIWLSVLAWPIWRASGCSSWGEIMMWRLGKNHNQLETIMQNHVWIEQLSNLMNESDRNHSRFLEIIYWVADFAVLTWGLRGGWEWMMLECLLCFWGRFPAKYCSYSTHTCSQRYLVSKSVSQCKVTGKQDKLLLTWKRGKSNFLFQWR